MTKTRLEKIADLETQVEQIRKRQRQERQKFNKEERTARTRRLCERHGLIESMLPDTIPLTADNFKIYLEKTILTEQSRRILNGLLTAQDAATPAQTGAGSAATPTDPPTAKPAETERENDEDGDGETANAQG